MAVSLATDGNFGTIGFAVLRWAGGAWQLVMESDLASTTIEAAGSDIRETSAVWRKGDPRCCPSGGTQARIWHWNGSRLVAGPWKQATPAKTKAVGFHLPLPGAISCTMSDDPGFSNTALPSGVGVYCQSANPQSNPQKAHTVRMGLSGRLAICRNRSLENRCNIGNFGEGTPTLGYGKQITVGRFRCRSLRTGVECTVIRSGKGFLFNSKGVSRVGHVTPRTAGALTKGYFKTPSGNIVCYYDSTKSPQQPYVLCGIRSGLKPKPPYTAECKANRLDYNADRVSLSATGPAHPIACAGDVGPFSGLVVGARVLGYGKTWSGGGLRCTSAVTGLTCRNKSSHGFFLSRAHWRSF